MEDSDSNGNGGPSRGESRQFYVEALLLGFLGGVLFWLGVSFGLEQSIRSVEVTRDTQIGLLAEELSDIRKAIDDSRNARNISDRKLNERIDRLELELEAAEEN